MFNLEQHQFMQRIESLFSSDSWDSVYEYISENIKVLDELKEFYDFCYTYRHAVSNVTINYDMLNNKLQANYSYSPTLVIRHLNLERKFLQIHGGVE